MKFLPPGEQQHSDDCEAHGKPRRQRERDGAEQISVDIQRRYYQPDIRLAFFVALADMLPVEHREPNAEHDQSGGERDEVGRVAVRRISRSHSLHRYTRTAASLPSGST